MTENELREIFKQADRAVLRENDIPTMVKQAVDSFPEDDRNSTEAAIVGAVTSIYRLNQTFTFEVLKALLASSDKA